MSIPTHVDAIFLPGILMPASVRYRPLLAALDAPGAVTKELEVYAGARPPESYTLHMEVDGLDRFADWRELGRFHLYGHSAGASVALAYVARHGDRVLSLALDEPASDFSPQDRATLAADLPSSLADLPVIERMRVFAASLVRPGVVLPQPPPPGPDATRPAGLAAFQAALSGYELEPGALEAYTAPVLYSYGGLSNVRWEAMGHRLHGQFAHCRVERYDDLHHLNASHVAEPQRVAVSLHELWRHADGR